MTSKPKGQSEPQKPLPPQKRPAPDPGSELKKLGKYQIEKKLGAGGMGTVYLATDTQLKRTVALKVLSKDKAGNPTLVKRFQAEAQAAAQLKHENIVSVYDSGCEDGYLYMALEYVDGRNIHDVITKKGPLSPKRSLDVIKQVTHALQHAFERSIVHRDIKPSNLLITRDGKVKLADMGLARSVDDSAQTAAITRAGTTVGTVDYLPPEQARNSKSADVRSDIYSLGCTWYHLLTGQPPYPDGDITNKINAHWHQPPPDPRYVNRSVPDGFVAVIQRMMAKDPKDRYQTPDELLADLERTTLSRAEVSPDVLAALANEEGQSPTAARRASVPAPASPSLTGLPPKDEPLPSEQKSGWSFKPSQKTIVASATVAIILLVGWVASQFGSGIDSVPPAAPQRSADTPAATSTPARRAAASKPEQPTVPKLAAGPKDEPKPSPAAGLIVPADLQIGRTGSEKQVPSWLKELLAAAPKTLSVVRVTDDSGAPGDAPTLDAALRHMPPDGAIIELVGSGPFFLTPEPLRDCGSVVIRAATGSRPLIVLIPAAGQADGGLFQISNASLTLQGVHVAALAEQFAGSDPVSLFAVQSGDFAALQCSFTLVGSRSGRTSAVTITEVADQTAARGARRSFVLLSDVFLRGEALEAVRLTSPAADLVTSNCLFATGDAPVFALSDAKAPGEPNPPSAELTRNCSFLSSTFFSNKTVLELIRTEENNDWTPLTRFVVADCLFATHGRESVLIALDGWKYDQLLANGMSRFTKLAWSVQASLFCGWHRLMETKLNPGMNVENAADWAEVWGTAVEPSQFLTEAWPKTPPPRFEFLFPQMLDSATVAGAAASDGNKPGCVVARLELPEAIALQRGRVSGHHRQPEMFAAAGSYATAPIEVNVKKQDIADALAGDKWPSGTVLRIVGEGDHFAKPIVVRGKSLRLEFVPTDGSPLTVLPQSLPNSAASYESFITVENGSIEIVNGRFRFPPAGRQVDPRWFLTVRGGSFQFTNCQVIGPMAGSDQFQGLIQWLRTDAESKPATGVPQYRESSAIINSFFASPRDVLQADMRRRAFFGRNSLLVSLGNVFKLSVAGFDAEVAGVFDLRRCTLSAADTFFRLSGTPEAAFANIPLTFCVSQSVFGPPVPASDAKSAAVTFLACPQSVREKDQIDWWGASNGYSSEIRDFVRDPDGKPSPQPQSFEEAWRKIWEATQIVNPVSGPDAVQFAGEFSSKTELAPQEFLLSPASSAHQAGRDGRPIGFEPAGFAKLDDRTEPPPVAPSAAPAETKTTTVAKPPKPTKPAPKKPAAPGRPAPKRPAF